MSWLNVDPEDTDAIFLNRGSPHDPSSGRIVR